MSNDKHFNAAPCQDDHLINDFSMQDDDNLFLQICNKCGSSLNSSSADCENHRRFNRVVWTNELASFSRPIATVKPFPETFKKMECDQKIVCDEECEEDDDDDDFIDDDDIEDEDYEEESDSEEEESDTEEEESDTEEESDSEEEKSDTEEEDYIVVDSDDSR